MNHFAPSLLATAITLFSITASFAGHPLHEKQNNTTILEQDIRESYSLSVLAIHPDGNRAYTSGTYSTLSAAVMAYQAFSFDLPEGATIIYANITDSNGTVIHSLSGEL